MATTSNNSVIVELYDNTLTERKDDRFGRVVTTKSLTEDDLVALVVARRTDLNATTLKASLDLMKDVAIEQLANGASVKFGLGYFNLGVSGVFIGDSAKWDSSAHSLFVKATPTVDLREAVASASVDVRGLAASGLGINAITDATSGEVNGRVTPGGGATIAGSRVKIAGDDASVGITFTNQATAAVTAVPATSLLTNEPSRLAIIIPASLAAGDYKLTVTTQYTVSSKTLKEPRSCTLEYVLTVTA